MARHCLQFIHLTPHSQRSIVILSHLAYPALFDAVLEKVAPIYFSHGYPALEAACHGIAGWYVNGTTLPDRPKTYMSMYPLRSGQTPSLALRWNFRYCRKS